MSKFETDLDLEKLENSVETYVKLSNLTENLDDPVKTKTYDREYEIEFSSLSPTSTQSDGDDNEEDPEEENPTPTGPGPPEDGDDIAEVEELVLEENFAASCEMKHWFWLCGSVWKSGPEWSCVEWVGVQQNYGSEDNGVMCSQLMIMVLCAVNTNLSGVES